MDNKKKQSLECTQYVFFSSHGVCVVVKCKALSKRFEMFDMGPRSLALSLSLSLFFKVNILYKCPEKKKNVQCWHKFHQKAS